MFRVGIAGAQRAVARSGAVKTVFRRTYAETVAAESRLKLQFALPHDILYNKQVVSQVNLPAKSGQIGILANHVPTVEQLTPGVVEIFETAGATPKKYFVSGGFATVQPDSTLCLTSVEAFPLDSFSQANIKTLLAEASKKASSSDETIAAEGAIQQEVLESLQASMK